MAFCNPQLVLTTARVRCTGSEMQTIGIVAVELLEESNRASSVARRHGCDRRTNGSFCCFTQSQRGLPLRPTSRFVALDCVALLQPDCASAENNSATGHGPTLQHSGDSSAGIRKREE